MDDVEDLARTLNKHLLECERQNAAVNRTLGVLSEGHEKIESALESFKSAAWRGLLAILGVLTVSAGTVIAQSYAITSKAATKDEVALRTASRYTADDAARDRATAAERDRELLEAIQAMRRGR